VHVREIKKMKILQTSLQKCISSASSRTADQEDFNLRLCEALLSAKPLNKVQNHKFKQFLETFCKKNIPHESTLRKNDVCSIYNNVIREIKSHIKDQFLYIIVDKTADVRGRYIANLLVGVLNLNENILPKSFLISTKELKKN
jgi:hypothetical protein